MKPDIADRTFQFAVRVVKLCRMVERGSWADKSIANQLLRSGTSIGANVAESQAAHSKTDFIAKLVIACKEAKECLYWLRLLGETGIVEHGRLSEVQDECNQLVSILTAIIKKSRLNSKL